LLQQRINPVELIMKEENGNPAAVWRRR